jgi:guanylate kinase
MIILIGSSAGGKSSIEKELVKLGYKNIISYTTRPIRHMEVNHKDYHFVTDDEFKTMKDNGFLAESTVYNSWKYGAAKEDCKQDNILVCEPLGFRQVKKFCDTISFYIEVPEGVRLKRMVDRGDNLMEMFRRIVSDQGTFNGVPEECDFIIDNNRPLEETVEEIYEILQNHGL